MFSGMSHMLIHKMRLSHVHPILAQYKMRLSHIRPVMESVRNQDDKLFINTGTTQTMFTSPWHTECRLTTPERVYYCPCILCYIIGCPMPEHIPLNR